MGVQAAVHVHVDRLARGDVQAVAGQQDRCRVGFALGQRVAADQHGAAPRPAETFDHADRQALGLVGDDAPAQAARLDRRQQFGDAGEGHAVHRQRLAVTRQEGRQQFFAFGLGQIRQGHRQHGATALGHHLSQARQRHRRPAQVGQHAVHRIAQVRGAVDQGAIEVEQHRTQRQRHQDFTAQAK